MKDSFLGPIGSRHGNHREDKGGYSAPEDNCRQPGQRPDTVHACFAIACLRYLRSRHLSSCVSPDATFMALPSGRPLDCHHSGCLSSHNLPYGRVARSDLLPITVSINHCRLLSSTHCIFTVHLKC